MTMMSGTSRNYVAPVQQGGLQASLNAPGLAVPSPVSAQAQQFNQMVQAMGLMGNAAAGVGQMADRETYMRERQQNILDSQFKGQASLDARAMLPGWLDKINSGEVVVPDGMDIETFVRQQVDSVLEDQPAAYAEQFRQTAVPTAIAAFTQRQRHEVDRIRAEELTVQAQAAWEAESPAEFTRMIAEARQIDPSLTEQGALNSVAVPVLQQAANAGDKRRFDMAYDAVKDTFPALAAQAKEKYDAVVEQKQRQQAARISQEYHEAVHTMVVNETAKDAPNWEYIEGVIRQWGEAHSVTASDVNSALSSARQQFHAREARLNQQHSENAALMVQQIVDLADAMNEDGSPRVSAGLLQSRVDEIQQAIGWSKARELRGYIEQREQNIAKQGHRMYVDTLKAQAYRGDVDPESLDAFLKDAVALDPSDPGRLTADEARSIQSFAEQGRQERRAHADVVSALQGNNVILPTTQHSAALLEIAQEKGWVQNNAIVDPQSMAVAMRNLHTLDSGMQQMIVASLVDPNATPSQRLAAARTIRMLDGHTGLHAIANVSDTMKNMIAKVNGIPHEILFSDDRMEAVIAQLQPGSTSFAETAGRFITTNRVNVERDTQRMLESVRNENPHVWRSWFNFWGASTDVRNPDMLETMQGWYREGIGIYSQANMSMADTVAAAQEYAIRNIRMNVDFVDLNGSVFPVMVGDMQPSPAMRWGPGSSAEFMTDMAAAGLNTSEITSVMPVMAQGGSMAWMPVDSNGQFMIDRGWIPSDPQQKANQEFFEKLAASTTRQQQRIEKQQRDLSLIGQARWQPMFDQHPNPRHRRRLQPTEAQRYDSGQ